MKFLLNLLPHYCKIFDSTKNEPADVQPHTVPQEPDVFDINFGRHRSVLIEDNELEIRVLLENHVFSSLSLDFWVLKCVKVKKSLCRNLRSFLSSQFYHDFRAYWAKLPGDQKVITHSQFLHYMLWNIVRQIEKCKIIIFH